MSNDERSTQVTITRKAGDKKLGLTLDELGKWMQEVHRAGIPGGTRVEVSAGFRSQIIEVKAKG